MTKITSRQDREEGKRQKPKGKGFMRRVTGDKRKERRRERQEHKK